jgi:hypothetical protein
MKPVWSPLLGAGSLFGPALCISVEASNPVITVITVIITGTTAAVHSSLAAEGAHRLQNRSHQPGGMTASTATVAAFLSACAATLSCSRNPLARLQSQPIQIIISDNGSLSVASLSVPLEAERFDRKKEHGRIW